MDFTQPDPDAPGHFFISSKIKLIFLSTIFPAKPKKTRRKILLPLLCSFLMPGISILTNNSAFAPGTDPRRVIGSWFSHFCYLLIIWAADQWIADRFKTARRSPAARLATQTIVNLLLITLFVNVSTLLYGLHLEIYPVFAYLKLLLASLVILSIQANLASLAEKEDILLANAELQNENLRARFEVLKQQVNPHFLFNALGTLRIMIREKDDRAETFILKLSDLYRQLLGKNTAQTITLDEELEFLRSYIYMLQARFESLLHIDIDILPGSGNLKIPAFSLQLLVENCIKHNIVSAARPLHIRIFQRHPDTILIENNLQLKPAAEESSGIGLDNLRVRYELLQVQNGVTIDRTETKFSVTLQLLT